MAAERPSDDLLGRILAAVAAEVTDERIDRLVAEARAEAEGEIKSLVKSAIKAALLRRTCERLEGAAGDDAPPATPPAPSSPPPGFGPRIDAGDDASAADAPPACYVYGITGAAPPAGIEGVATVYPHSPLEFVRHENVQAIVQRVPLAEFGQAALDERIGDAQWVEAKVRAHDEVVKLALSAGAVIPCRFCTVVRDAADVRRLLAEHHGRIEATLTALEGKTEWGVKIHHRPDRRGTAEAASGRAYLTNRQQEARDRRDRERAARELAEQCHRELAAAAAEALKLPARKPVAAGDDSSGAVLVNGAYLVPDAGAERFHAAVAALAEEHAPRGLVFDVTGPWPPYNFVRLDLSLEAAA